MKEKMNITEDPRFVFPVPGLKFLYLGQEVDLRSISEEQAMRLAKDQGCRFIKLKEDVATTAPAAPVAPAVDVPDAAAPVAPAADANDAKPPAADGKAPQADVANGKGNKAK